MDIFARHRAPRGWMNKVSSRLHCGSHASLSPRRIAVPGSRGWNEADDPTSSTRGVCFEDPRGRIALPRRRQRAGPVFVPPASYAASLVAEHSGSAARVLMDKGWGERNGAGRVGINGAGTRPSSVRFFAAPRKCRLWRGVLRRREVRGDRRLRGADRPIESGAVRVHVCPPLGAGARRCLS